MSDVEGNHSDVNKDDSTLESENLSLVTEESCEKRAAELSESLNTNPPETTVPSINDDVSNLASSSKSEGDSEAVEAPEITSVPNKVTVKESEVIVNSNEAQKIDEVGAVTGKIEEGTEVSQKSNGDVGVSEKSNESSGVSKRNDDCSKVSARGTKISELTEKINEDSEVTARSNKICELTEKINKDSEASEQINTDSGVSEVTNDSSRLSVKTNDNSGETEKSYTNSEETEKVYQNSEKNQKSCEVSEAPESSNSEVATKRYDSEVISKKEDSEIAGKSGEEAVKDTVSEITVKGNEGSELIVKCNEDSELIIKCNEDSDVITKSTEDSEVTTKSNENSEVTAKSTEDNDVTTQNNEDSGIITKNNQDIEVTVTNNKESEITEKISERNKLTAVNENGDELAEKDKEVASKSSENSEETDRIENDGEMTKKVGSPRIVTKVCDQQEAPLVTDKEESDCSSEHSFVVLDEVESAGSGNDDDTIKENGSPRKRMKRKLANEKSPRKKLFSPFKQHVFSSTLNNATILEESKSKIREEIKEVDDEIGLVLEEMNTDDDEDDSETKNKQTPDKLHDCSEIDSALEEMAVEDEENQILANEVESLIDDWCESDDSEKPTDRNENIISSDSESLKDGIDIECVIEAICDDEDEILDTVDNIIKSKSSKDEADSKAIESVLDSICEEEKESEDKISTTGPKTTVISNSASSAAGDGSSKNFNVKTGASCLENRTMVKKNVYRDAAETVMNALLNVVSLQVEQGLALEKISALESAVNRMSEEKTCSSEVAEKNFVISNVMSSTLNLGAINEKADAVKRPSENESPVHAKKARLETESPYSSEDVSSDVVTGGSDSQSCSVDDSSSFLQIEESKAKTTLRVDKAASSNDSSNSVDADVSETNSVDDPDILISCVETCTDKAVKADNCVIQPTDKSASSQAARCSPGSQFSASKLIEIDGGAKAVTDFFSSSVKKESSPENKIEGSSAQSEHNSSIVKEELKNGTVEPMFETAEVEDVDESLVKGAIAFLNGESEFEVLTPVASPDHTSGISESNNPSNGVSTIRILSKLPRKIDESNEEQLVELTDPELGKIIRQKVHQHCSTKYQEKIAFLEKQVNALKQEATRSVAYLALVKAQVRELATSQSSVFRQFEYVPKAEKRTVGVNVRIVQQQPGNRPRTYSNMSNLSNNVGSGSQVSNNTSAANSASVASQASSPSSSILGSFLQTPKTASANTSTSAQGNSNNSVTIKPSQSPVKGTKPAVSTNQTVMVLTNNSSSSSHQVVDLTDDDSPKHKTPTTVPAPVRATTPVRGQLPPRPGTPQNLVSLPLMTSLPSMVQLLPPGTTVTNSLVDGSAVRMVRSSGITQPARLAYIMPNTTGSVPMIHQIGGNPPRLVNVSPQQLSNMRQPMQTFVLTPMPVVSQGPSAVAKTTVPSLAGVSPTFTTTSTLPSSSSSQLTLTPCYNKHPAPLPVPPIYPPDPKLKALPPKPSLKMNKVSNGIVLSWNMNVTTKHAEISSYQLYAYQENKGPVSHLLWKKVGDIKALPLPMACTLTQFVEGHKYHFSVRAVDVHKRLGPFSEPASILLYIRPKAGEPSATQASPSS